MSRPGPVRRAILASAAVFSVSVFAANDPTRSFDLPEQDAITGVPAFAGQAGLQILVAESAVRGKRTAAIRGDLAIRAALRQLLANTNLAVISDDGVTITLGPIEDDESDVVEEVIVTALRRQQSLRDVPAAVTAVSGKTLRAKGAQDYRDYLTSIPGVYYTESGLRAVRVTIRGVSDGIGATDPLTGIYLDEMPITESFQATLDPSIYDVERVEVLKGPQGTLYGSGSMGGTVRIITRKPRIDAIEATVEGTFGEIAHGGTNRRVDGVFNLPVLTERAALRVSGGYREDAGWIDNVLRGDRDDNTVEKANGRAQLLLKPGEATSIVFGMLYQSEELGSPFVHDLSLPDHQAARAFHQSGRSDARLYSATLEHNFDGISLISASNYLAKNTLNSTDSTATLRPLLELLSEVSVGPAEGLGAESGNGLELFTQEVRLSSAGSNRFDWVAGAFYSNAVTETTTTFDFSQAPSTDGVTTGPDFYSADQEYRIRQIATFGELTWNVTSQLSLTAGARIFDVDQRNTLLGSGTLNGGDTAIHQEASSSSSTKKFLAKYQVTRENMIYAQASQGYRNGGPTGGFPQAACAAGIAAAGYSSVPSRYGPDKLWNYEIGSKNVLLNGRMTLDGAAFYIDWGDIQSSIGLSCGFTFTVNAGEASSKGAELDLTLRPWAELTLTAAASYIDAEMEEAAPGGLAGDGDPLPLTSEWSWNVSGQYERNLTAGLLGFVRAEASHVGERWNTFRSVAAYAHPLEDYTTFNLRIGVAGEHWSAALFGTNLTDERIVTYRPNDLYEILSTPRVIGFNVSVNLQ